jgi:uncharacterized membrane protein
VSYVALGLMSGLLLGVWKFGLSFYRGQVSVYSIVLVSASSAALAYFVAGMLSGTLIFDSEDMVEGFLGGACNLAGTLLLLEGYKRGKIGVVTGIAASCVLIPIAYSFIIGEVISPLMAVGVAVLFLGMATFYIGSTRGRGEKTESISRDAMFFAFGAALFWGLAIVILDVGTLVSLTGTLTVSQVPQVAFTLVMVLVGARRTPVGFSARMVAVLAGAGFALALGNMTYFAAANEGDIGVVSVLGAISPLVTALLAVIFLRERLARLEVTAFGIVLVGTVLVAL